MFLSVAYLHARCEPKEVAAAALIMLGACLSVVPSLLSADGGEPRTEIRWYAVLLYALSNFPIATSTCYKEEALGEQQLDVWYVTQWVTTFQFLATFLFMPLQTLPGLGSRDGMPLSQVPEAFMDGLLCYAERVPECAGKGAFLLLNGFVVANLCYTIAGLYLTTHGSAVLNALSYSLLLPFTTCVFFTPLLGPYQERLTWTSAFTLCGLVLTLCGFAVYQRSSQDAGGSDDDAPSPEAPSGDGRAMNKTLTEHLLAMRSVTPQPSFNQRTLGMIRVKSSALRESGSSRRLSTPW